MESLPVDVGFTDHQQVDYIHRTSAFAAARHGTFLEQCVRQMGVHGTTSLDAVVYSLGHSAMGMIGIQERAS